MTCYSPIKAYVALTKTTANGKSLIVFNRAEVSSGPFQCVQLPCSQCIGCRISRSKEWALRCVHEASLWESNSFITLTFNEDNLEPSGSLVKRDFQLFMKRLRKEFKGLESVVSDSGKETWPIRYFHCGEYGDKMTRPHHHACLFNFDFPDKKKWCVRKGNQVFRSDLLEGLWPFGFSEIGQVNYQSAAYIARYITKKINGPHAASHYYRVDDDGEAFYLEPEFITMSRRPGLASRWFAKYSKDVYPKDFVSHGGVKHHPPKYYDKIYDVQEPKLMAVIKQRRKVAARESVSDKTLKGLKSQAVVATADNALKVRGLEHASAKDVLYLRQKIEDSSPP